MPGRPLTGPILLANGAAQHDIPVSPAYLILVSFHAWQQAITHCMGVSAATNPFSRFPDRQFLPGNAAARRRAPHFPQQQCTLFFLTKYRMERKSRGKPDR